MREMRSVRNIVGVLQVDPLLNLYFLAEFSDSPGARAGRGGRRLRQEMSNPTR